MQNVHHNLKKEVQNLALSLHVFISQEITVAIVFPS